MKLYTLLFTPTTQHYIRHLNPQAKAAIKSVLQELKINPYPGKALHSDFKGLHSLRYKKYRIIYKIIESKHQLQILLAGSRDNIYDELSKVLRGLKQ